MTTHSFNIPERRGFTRHKARTRVQVRRSTGDFKYCQAVDLSANGVGIKTDGMGLRVGESCELNFTIYLGNLIKIHRRTAVVKHCSGGVTGFAMKPYQVVETK